MRRSVALTFACVFGTAAQSTVAVAQDCNLSASFKQNDPRGVRTVLSDPPSLVFSTKMRVDADGGPHAYSAKDPAGSLCDPRWHKENVGRDPIALGCAMDSVCDGAAIKTPSGELLDDTKCSALLAAFKLIRDSNWKPPVGYELRPVGIEMKGPNTPCLDANDAYMVSTSSTPSGEGGGACDQRKWLDTMVPSIVVPKCWSNTYRAKNPHTCASPPAAGVAPDVDIGDLAALHGRSSGKIFYAVIGDLGPNSKLGEASVGLLMLAAGQTKPPAYLGATDALDQREQFDVVVFKHSAFAKPLTVANVKEMGSAAEDAFKGWGGDLANAQKRLSACGRAAAP
jgi:hypothetical protein